ncbi:MAG TPA: diaminopimelate decarboxylase [Burkholderiales bacterium]|nr:diaminopimelate decarboxylase [Burkholderiales bacterium]
MSAFSLHSGQLYVEKVALPEIAERFGTPCFVYSRAALEQAYLSYDRAFGGRSHLICYAMKANSNLAILNLFARLGSGFDIVSGGELARVIAAGGSPGKTVFSGVGKTRDEMRQALGAGVLCFNVESESELERLNDVARELRRKAPVSLRVNPDVDAKTHPYISTGRKENKFGIAYGDALRIYRKARGLGHLHIVGIDCHIGSQLTELAPFIDALNKVLELVDKLSAEGIELKHVDLGGGLGIRYRDESPPLPDIYVKSLLKCLGERPQEILLEPGRALVGNAGLLLTRVEYLKHEDTRNFAVVDAAMNDLIRPALYDGYHEIRQVEPSTAAPKRYQIVGPVCETADFLGNDRDLALKQGDLLAVMSAGAYGMSMSSNYNSRLRAAEVMVDGDTVHLIRERDRVEQLFSAERMLMTNTA